MLLISGDSDPRLSERAFAQGADAFFPKPYRLPRCEKNWSNFLC